MVVESKFSRHTYSYLALRKTVGWIGILLPFTLMFGVYLIFQGKLLQPSISHYYHTGMRDVFVGALCAVALFMFFYSGYDKWDDRAGNVAGFAALGIALFPTTEVPPNDFIGMLHFAFAVIFFVTLSVFSLFLFTKTNKDADVTPEKRARNKIYIACGIIMLACMIAIVIYLNFFDDGKSKSPFVFVGETIALVAFGFSWLTKGGAIYSDKDEKAQ